MTTTTEPQNLEPETQNPLSESLAWLDFCLGETQAALAAVKDAALEAMQSPEGPGWKVVLGQIEPYQAMCEAAAGIITLRGRAKKWGKAGSGLQVLGSGEGQEGDLGK